MLNGVAQWGVQLKYQSADTSGIEVSIDKAITDLKTTLQRRKLTAQDKQQSQEEQEMIESEKGDG